MKFRVPPRALSVFAAGLATFTIGLAVAQQPQPSAQPLPAPASAPVPVPVPDRAIAAPVAVVNGSLPVPAAPVIQAKAWVLLDAASGRVLAGQNYDVRSEPASITKVMTSYVVAAEMATGKVKGTDPVMMTEEAWREGGAGTDGSYSGFPVNQTAPLIDMEKGMVIQSGNDAALALAQHIAGSTAAFADLMNQYAAKIGMKNSHFVNPTGLPDPNHYSTAHDLALLGRALARDYPVAYSYNSIKEFTVGKITQPNRNLLLWRDSSVDGIKTGHTESAGYCLMGSAKRGVQRLISVVLGDTSMAQRATDSMALLDYGFRFYESHIILDGKTPVFPTQRVYKGSVSEIAIGAATPFVVTVERGKFEGLKKVVELKTPIIAPLTKGQVVGTIRMMQGNTVVGEAPLVAMQDVAEGGFFRRIWDSLMLHFAK